MRQGDGKGKARNGRALPACCFAPSPTSAPAKWGTTGDISSPPSALPLRHPVSLQICLGSRGPDRENAALTPHRPWDGEWQHHRSRERERLAPARSAVGFPTVCGWQRVTCLPVPSEKVHPCLVQLGSCRGGRGHAALQRQARYTRLWLRLAAITQNPSRKWPACVLPAH